MPVLIGLIARMLLSWWPLGALQKLIGAVNGMPSDAATVTAEFIQAPGAVRQALYVLSGPDIPVQSADMDLDILPKMSSRL